MTGTCCGADVIKPPQEMASEKPRPDSQLLHGTAQTRPAAGSTTPYSRSRRRTAAERHRNVIPIVDRIPDRQHKIRADQQLKPRQKSQPLAILRRLRFLSALLHAILW